MTQTPEPLAVIQSDREAAADWMSCQSYDWGFCGDVRSGRVESDLVAAFARHRIEHATPSPVEGMREERVVPIVPTEAQWGGLARDIMMWLDFGPGQKTPRALFKHLERCGSDIPQWLRDEPEMQALDHVPSKGTRCAIIYWAMLEAAALPLPGEG